jgi:hypothetical protein
LFVFYRIKKQTKEEIREKIKGNFFFLENNLEKIETGGDVYSQSESSFFQRKKTNPSLKTPLVLLLLFGRLFFSKKYGSSCNFFLRRNYTKNEINPV